MKKVSRLTVILMLICQSAFPQLAGQFIQGTLKSGSTANSVKVFLKSSTSYKGNFSNVQFTFQIPNSLVPQPTVSIKSNALSAYIPTANYNTQVTNEGGYYNYLFTAVVTGSPDYNFSANNEVEALEVEAKGANGQVEMRLASLANGGSTLQQNFYIELNGNNNTNISSMFYGINISNSGSYSSYSYVSLANVILPVKLVNFTAKKDNKNAVLIWNVLNQSLENSHFEIERSTNSLNFFKIGDVNIIDNGSITNTYKYTDATISKLVHNGMIYYRLKQFDKNGQFEYSNIVNIRVERKALNASLHPNPTMNSSLLNFTLDKAFKVNILVYDGLGKLLLQMEFTGQEGVNRKWIDLSGLKNGEFKISIRSDNSIETLKLIKAK